MPILTFKACQGLRFTLSNGFCTIGSMHDGLFLKNRRHRLTRPTSLRGDLGHKNGLGGPISPPVRKCYEGEIGIIITSPTMRLPKVIGPPFSGNLGSESSVLSDPLISGVWSSKRRFVLSSPLQPELLCRHRGVILVHASLSGGKGIQLARDAYFQRWG